MKSVDDVIGSIQAGEFPGLPKELDVETGLARLVLDLWLRVDQLEKRVFKLEGRD
jgi:hypothetical protein